MGCACSTHVRNAYKIFVRKLKGNRPLGRARFIWEDINMDRKEIA